METHYTICLVAVRGQGVDDFDYPLHELLSHGVRVWWLKLTNTRRELL